MVYAFGVARCVEIKIVLLEIRRVHWCLSKPNARAANVTGATAIQTSMSSNLTTTTPPSPPTMSTSYQALPGRLGNLTPEQLEILEQFRKELTDEKRLVPERHDDATLLRFLRARKFDLAKAKEMFIAAEQWRKDFGVDDIVKSVGLTATAVDHSALTNMFIRNFQFLEKEQVNQYYPQYYHKTDKVSSFLARAWLDCSTFGCDSSLRMFIWSCSFNGYSRAPAGVEPSQRGGPVGCPEVKE